MQARQPSVDQLEDSACQLDPRVEGRILELTEEVVHTLLLILGLSSDISKYLPISCISLVVSSMGTQAPLRIMSVKY